MIPVSYTHLDVYKRQDTVRFVTALNCRSAETAFDAMRKTKEKFGKTGGVLGYHFIQSFAPGEVTPEQAHEIGCEFARRLFGEDFEAVIEMCIRDSLKGA